MIYVFVTLYFQSPSLELGMGNTSNCNVIYKYFFFLVFYLVGWFIRFLES